jgi:hypothetical protein
VWVCVCVREYQRQLRPQPVERGRLLLVGFVAGRAGWSAGRLAGLGGLHGQARCVGGLAGWLRLPAAPPHCEMQQSLRSLGFDCRYTGTQTTQEWVYGMYWCT